MATVDKVHERLAFKSLAWLLEHAKSNVEKFDVWTYVCLPEDFHQCGCCAPAVPSIRWMKLDKRIRAIEDASQAGAYERALKNRPTPFINQLKFGDDFGVGTVRIGVNVPSTGHIPVCPVTVERRVHCHAHGAAHRVFPLQPPRPF